MPGQSTITSAAGAGASAPTNGNTVGGKPAGANTAPMPGTNGLNLAGTQNAASTGAPFKPADNTPTAGTDLIKNMNAYADIESKLRTNDLEGAEKTASALVERDPHNGKGWLLLGRIAEKKGDLDSASVSYRQATYLKEGEAKTALDQIDSSRVQPILKEAD